MIARRLCRAGSESVSHNQTDANLADGQSGKATSPQGVCVDEVDDALIAPAVEDEPGTEARAESNEGETEIKAEGETADLKVGVGPVPPSAVDVAEHRVTQVLPQLVPALRRRTRARRATRSPHRSEA